MVVKEKLKIGSLPVIIQTGLKIIGRSSHLEVLLRKGVLKICSKFTREYPYRSAISMKLLYNFIQITLRRRCPL